MMQCDGRLCGRFERRDGISGCRTSRCAATHPMRETFSLAPQGLQEHCLAIGRPEEPAVLGIASSEGLYAAHIAKRKASAKRNQRRTATRQTAQHLRTVRIA